MLILFLLLIILFNIGRAFFNMAKKYGKKKQLYTLLGILVFVILGTLSFLLAYFILITIMHWAFNTNWLFYWAYSVGIIGAITVHYLLEKKWKEEAPEIDTVINEIGNMN